MEDYRARRPRRKMWEAQNGGKPVFEWIHIDSKGQSIPCEVRLIRLPAENKVLIRGKYQRHIGTQESRGLCQRALHPVADFKR
jgi:hypothetical protein